MFKFNNLTHTNGLDKNNLINARQNNYAWSMSELDDYIYVGTGRNVLLVILQQINQNINIPISIKSTEQNNTAEIWRYKKGSEKDWEKVFTGREGIDYGFRYMTNFRPFNGNTAIYASSAVLSGNLKVYKSVNGVDWKEVSSNVKGGGMIQGTSSRAMLSHNGRLYMATVDDSGNTNNALLYSSKDPEFYSWKLETPLNADANSNPTGAIYNMAVFNNRIYVATTGDNGVQVWRTNGKEPKVNDWTLVVDNGFGDSDNVICLSIGIFKNHLYVSGTKELPLSWAIPRGADIVRIDKNDNWEVVVGPNSVSGTWSGFFNPFNVYAWQIQEYNGKLLVTTFDDATNIQTILEILLANRQKLSQPPISLPNNIVDILITVYKLAVELLNKFHYPFGFDMYVSEDGKHFEPVFLNGLDNRYNYGGRILYVDSRNDLYIGTANPYQGLEVWKAKECNCNFDEMYEYIDEEYDYRIIKEEIEKHFEQVNEYMPQIRACLSQLIGNYFKYR